MMMTAGSLLMAALWTTTSRVVSVTAFVAPSTNAALPPSSSSFLSSLSSLGAAAALGGGVSDLRLVRRGGSSSSSSSCRHRTTRLSSTSASSSSSYSQSQAASIETCLSRMGTLQVMLSRHGAPGSKACRLPDGDLVSLSVDTVPELVSSLSGNTGGGGIGGVGAGTTTATTTAASGEAEADTDGDKHDDDMSNLHPYLFPIARSTTSGNYVCAYRNPLVEEADGTHPWPIVEARIGGPGMRLLALNSEHLMRRIVCECDYEGKDDDLIRLYNEGLEGGLGGGVGGSSGLEARVGAASVALDIPYEPGSVSELGYGVDKYVLLRVGPFPDLYERMSLQHASRNDEQSSLIAAEAANTKLAGFGSNFRFYARMLSKFPNRSEETRDAARMCLRLPLSTIGISYEDFKEVAVLGQMANEDDALDTAIQKMKVMYDKIREVEREDGQQMQQLGGRSRPRQQPPLPGDDDGSKTPEQIVIDDATLMLDNVSLGEGKNWRDVRPDLVQLFHSVKRHEMANFIDMQWR